MTPPFLAGLVHLAGDAIMGGPSFDGWVYQESTGGGGGRSGSGANWLTSFIQIRTNLFESMTHF